MGNIMGYFFIHIEIAMLFFLISFNKVYTLYYFPAFLFTFLHYPVISFIRKHYNSAYPQVYIKIKLT